MGNNRSIRVSLLLKNVYFSLSNRKKIIYLMTMTMTISQILVDFRNIQLRIHTTIKYRMQDHLF